MKNTPESHNALPVSSKAIHIWILAALLANALLLCVIALQIRQVGHQLTSLARQDNAPEPYAYSGMSASEHPYSINFAKNEGYTAYRVAKTEPIPVRIVDTPLSVEVKNDPWHPIPVTEKK